MKHNIQITLMVIVWLVVVISLYSCQQKTTDNNKYEIVYEDLYIYEEQSLSSVVDYWKGHGFIDIKTNELNNLNFYTCIPHREVKVTIKIEAVDGK